MSFVLLALTGHKAGVRYGLEPGVTVVGRASDSGIQVIDDAVSRHHARFSNEDGAVWVEDLGSQNGTRLDGAPLLAPHRLAPGDAVEIGATTFVFEPRLEYLPSGGPDVIVAEDATATSRAATRVRGDEDSEEARVAASAALAHLARGDLTDAGELLAEALGALATRFGAERGFVVRVSADAPDRPRVVASVGPGPITVSRTVVQAVLQGPSALYSEDATADAVLSAGVSLRLGGVRSLVAAPLVASGRTLGMVHLDRAERGGFGPADVARLVPHARVLALVVLAQEALTARRVKVAASNRIDAPEMIALAPASVALLAETRRAAASRANVLVTGETGTGKELIARLVHTEGPRAGGPFVAVNCAAIPEDLQASELFGHAKGAFTGADKDRPGLFEAADGGTLFLDEVAEMSRATQVKLLRALQERVVTRLGETRPRAVDVRVVAATHRRLEEQVLQGGFREDLYYRLAVVHLRVPALAARPEDILPLARRFAELTAREGGRHVPAFSRPLEAALVRYGWPGNVRELRNTIERMVILGDEATLDLQDLPTEMWSGGDAAQRAIDAADTLGEAVARLEKEMILRAMARTGGVKSATAEALGISRVTLDAKLKAHDIPWRRGRK